MDDARQVVSRDASPLRREERLGLDRCLRRLHEAMRELWSSWPLARRNASQISRELQVDRTTCQRLAFLARQHYLGEAMLESLPGPRAFRNLIDACIEHHAPPRKRSLDNLSAAVDGLDELLRDFGSLSQLKRRLVATPTRRRAVPTPSPGSAPADDRADAPPSLPEIETSAAEISGEDRADLDARRALFRAACQLTGRYSTHTISLGLYDQVDVTDRELRHVRIGGSQGMVARSNAVPLVLETFEGTEVIDSKAPADAAAASDASDTSRGDGEPWQRSPALLKQFTSAEWKSVDLRRSPGFAGRALEITKSERPSNLAWYTTFPVPHPRTLDEPIEESWFIFYNPTAMLIFDLYLHESIARQCLLSLDIHLWQTSFANFPHGRWHTRLPHAPRIIQLGRPAPDADHAGNESLHNGLTRELFTISKVDPAEYIGYRCEHPYPVWRAGYRFELDFGRG